MLAFLLAPLQWATAFSFLVAPAADWSPLDLGSALVAAYDPTDATTLTLSGSSVSQWNDLSSNHYNLVQATGANQPVYSATSFMGQPGITFDGTNDFLAAASVNPGTNKFGVFAFMQQSLNNTSDARFLGYTSGAGTNDFSAPDNFYVGIQSSATDNITGYRGGRLSVYLYANIAPSDGGYYRIGSVWDGTNHTLYADNVAQTAVANSGNLTTGGTIRLGSNTGGASNWKGATGRIILTKGDLTSTDRNNIDAWLQAPWGRVVCVEGDSKATWGTPNGNTTPFTYAWVVIPNLNPPAIVNDRAIGGSALNADNTTAGTINTSLLRGNRAAWADSSLPTNKRGKAYILFVDIGSNSFDGGVDTAAQVANQVADIITYCAARKAAGWDKVVITTLLSRTDGGGLNNAQRNAYNPIITNSGWSGRTANGGPVDAVADFAADSIMGVDDAPTVNPTYFSDGVHPNAAGNLRLEAIMRITINGL